MALKLLEPYVRPAGSSGMNRGCLGLVESLQSIRQIQAADFSDWTIAAKLKNPGYMLAEGAVIE